MRKSRHTLFIYIGTLIAFLLTACDNQTVYNRYLRTARSGWERNDTLSFLIPPVAQDGNYTEEIGVRINGDYPFLKLSLIIEQTKMNTLERRTDTLECELIDKNGHPLGPGISQYQYVFRLSTLHLMKNDSLLLSVRHDMKREMLPGVTGIGVRISKEKVD